MKRYSIAMARKVNEHASKSGIQFQYNGRTDDPERIIEWYEKENCVMGMRITDSITKEVIYENLREAE